MSRPKRKCILFLVEGYTDINVLSAGMLDLYEQYSDPGEYEIKFCTLNQNGSNGGDIISCNGVTPDNIEQMISKLYIDPFLQKNPFIYPKEISEVIHIIDMDGAFVEDDLVRLNTAEMTNRRVFYGEEQILAADPVFIRERNKRKRDNIKKLFSKDKIIIRPKNHRNTKSINYSVYYFSCNMDHYIHGEANLSAQIKVRKSDDFVLECYDNTDKFCNRLCNGPGALNGLNYQESWEFITQRGLNSLKCHTNINLLIQKIKG